MKAIILAAGLGTRMMSDKPKVLHEILKKSMIHYVIDAVKKSDFDDLLLVVGHKKDEVIAHISNIDSSIVCLHQEEQLGTGHAVKMAYDHIDDDEQVLILYGDTPIINENTLKYLKTTHNKSQNSVTLVCAETDDPTGYGRIIQEKNSLKIIEEKDASEEEKLINLVNVGVYMFEGKALKLALDEIKNNNSKKEYYLTDAIEILVENNHKTGVMVADDFNEFLGVNDKKQLAQATEIIKNRNNNYHLQRGITIVSPASTFIGNDVTIGKDTIIHPNNTITGKSCIGNRCNLETNNNLHDVNIGDEVEISNTVASKCSVGSFSSVGPFAYIRPNSIIGKNCKIGDFVEVKNSNIGNNTKASHLTYIGDSEVGNNINFGCGTVTVNYDGSNKFKTVIEDDVFIGCNTNLIAPVVLKKGSFVAAGSTITKDVPSENLGLARSKQINIENWKRP